MSGESGYMPRNFAELKSGGGTIPMLSPHAEKWGGGGARDDRADDCGIYLDEMLEFYSC